MKKNTLAAIAISAIVLPAVTLINSTAFAEHKSERKSAKMQKKTDRMLEKLDTDKDSAISLEEFQKKSETRFNEMDSDKNGSISVEELQKHIASKGWRKKRKGKGKRKHSHDEHNHTEEMTSEPTKG